MSKVTKLYTVTAPIHDHIVIKLYTITARTRSKLNDGTLLQRVINQSTAHYQIK